jgi:two-component system, OmpR family, sensor kinase
VGRFYLRLWFTVFITGLAGMFIGIMATRLFVDVPSQLGNLLLNTLSADEVFMQPEAGPIVAKLARLKQSSGLNIRVMDKLGNIIASTNDMPKQAGQEAEKTLPNGVRLQIMEPFPPGPAPQFAVVSLLLIPLGIGLATYPIVRRIARRLENLKASVEALGAGKLDVQVQVQGNDEVAALAKSFNASAQRISKLIASNRSLLANASHELRSPLARVRMATELMAQKSGFENSNEANEIRLSIQELDALIDEILTGSSLESAGLIHSPEHTALDQLVRDECQRLGVQLHAQAIRTAVHPVLYRRMIRNLLENAVKYGMGQSVNVELYVAGGRVQCCVKDLGIGVPEEEAQRIFEPFYRRKGASEVSGGVGLGLALAREIARKHGGDITCHPNQPRGTVFCAWTPLQELKNTATAPSSISKNS